MGIAGSAELRGRNVRGATRGIAGTQRKEARNCGKPCQSTNPVGQTHAYQEPMPILRNCGKRGSAEGGGSRHTGAEADPFPRTTSLEVVLAGMEGGGSRQRPPAAIFGDSDIYHYLGGRGSRQRPPMSAAPGGCRRRARDGRAEWAGSKGPRGTQTPGGDLMRTQCIKSVGHPGVPHTPSDIFATLATWQIVGDRGCPSAALRAVVDVALGVPRGL